MSILNWTGWNVLDKLSIVVSLLAVVPVIWTWLLVRRVELQRRQQLMEVRRSPGHRPAVLVIGVGADIVAQVENYLGQQAWYRQLDRKPQVHKIIHEGDLRADDIDKIMEQVAEAERQIMATGCDKIHLFLMSPVALAARVGSHLSNHGPVVVYQLNRVTRQYENWGLL